MAQIINTNISTLTAQRNANRVQNDLSTSINRLSSGLRINSAKDDAAGLAISERMTTQIRGLNQAARNANDAISLAQTAEGALSSASENLQRIRELAVQSANATNSASDRAALNAEAAALIAEVQRVGLHTEFNGIKLLDGSFQAQTFQVGANAGQTITVDNLVDARTTSLGSHTLATAGSKMGSTMAAAANNSAGNNIAAESTLRLSTTGGTTSAISWADDADLKTIAAAINAAGTDIGITATATNAAKLQGLNTAGVVSFDLNGKVVTANVTSTTDLTALANAINGAGVGISATFASSGAKDALVLTSDGGGDIRLSDFTLGAATIQIGNYDAATGAATNMTTLTSGGNDSTTVIGKIQMSSTEGAISYASATATDVFSAASGIGTFTSVAVIDISTANGASSALSVIDAALTQVNSGRADLGAVQNRFQATISSLETTSENLSASRSRVMDADFAKETAALSRAQVLQQAANAMVAQANQMPQQVLQLLQR